MPCLTLSYCDAGKSFNCFKAFLDISTLYFTLFQCFFVMLFVKNFYSIIPRDKFSIFFCFLNFKMVEIIFKKSRMLFHIKGHFFYPAPCIPFKFYACELTHIILLNAAKIQLIPYLQTK